MILLLLGGANINETNSGAGSVLTDILKQMGKKVYRKFVL